MSLPSTPTAFDAMISKSQKRRYHKYDVVYQAVEKVVACYDDLRAFWRSLDRRARATAAATITNGTASIAFCGFEAAVIAHLRERVVVAQIQPSTEVGDVD